MKIYGVSCTNPEINVKFTFVSAGGWPAFWANFKERAYTLFLYMMTALSFTIMIISFSMIG